jgi:hypothetical protein
LRPLPRGFWLRMRGRGKSGICIGVLGAVGLGVRRGVGWGARGGAGAGGNLSGVRLKGRGKIVGVGWISRRAIWKWRVRLRLGLGEVMGSQLLRWTKVQ